SASRGSGSQPVSTGLTGIARRPRRRAWRRSPALTRVLPTPVSVPVTNRPRRGVVIGWSRGARGPTGPGRRAAGGTARGGGGGRNRVGRSVDGWRGRSSRGFGAPRTPRGLGPRSRGLQGGSVPRAGAGEVRRPEGAR